MKYLESANTRGLYTYCDKLVVLLHESLIGINLLNRNPHCGRRIDKYGLTGENMCDRLRIVHAAPGGIPAIFASCGEVHDTLYVPMIVLCCERFFFMTRGASAIHRRNIVKEHSSWVNTIS